MAGAFKINKMYNKKQMCSMLGITFREIEIIILNINAKHTRKRANVKFFNEKTFLLIQEYKEKTKNFRTNKYSSKKIRIIEFWLLNKTMTSKGIANHLQLDPDFINLVVHEYLENETITVASKL